MTQGKLSRKPCIHGYDSIELEHAGSTFPVGLVRAGEATSAAEMRDMLAEKLSEVHPALSSLAPSVVVAGEIQLRWVATFIVATLVCGLILWGTGSGDRQVDEKDIDLIAWAQDERTFSVDKTRRSFDRLSELNRDAVRVAIPKAVIWVSSGPTTNSQERPDCFAALRFLKRYSIEEIDSAMKSTPETIGGGPELAAKAWTAVRKLMEN